MFVCLHPPAAGLVAFSKRNVDPALLGRRPAFNHRPIAFRYFALLEELAEQCQRLAMASENQASGGVAIEAMRQGRRARQSKPQGVEIVFEGIAPFRAAMHGQSRRLVDDEHKSVAVEQAGERLFRCHGHLPRFAETAITSTM